MRNFSRRGPAKIARRTYFTWLGVAAVGIALPGCAGGGAGSGTVPPPPPAISVSVSPPTGSVLLGKNLSLTASVTGTTNTAVTWAVNGMTGGNSVVGTISADGSYTAPADLPSPATVHVTATSMASPSSSASAQVTVTSDITVGVSTPNAAVELGARQSFAASLTSAGQPDTAIHWLLSGAACPLSCGSVDANGNYTAPQILPAQPSLILTAQSAADPAKRANIAITITSRFTLQLTAPGTLAPSATATIVAVLTPISGSNPSTVLNWSLTGAGCNNSSCGTLSAVTTQIQGASSAAIADTESANFTAPGAAPVPNTVTITAIPIADPSKKAQATIAVQAGIGITLSPASATIAINHRLTFAVQVNGTANSNVAWTVNGVPAGNTALGQVCVAGSNPCAPVVNSSNAQIDFAAPGSLPAPNPVTLQATSLADTSKFVTAQVTVVNHVVVSVLPGNVTLAPGATQLFSASVLGTANQSVVWQLQGAACANSSGCGNISAAGLYTAPATAPAPNTLQVVAVSSDDTSQSAFANITITSGANLQSLHPASVYAGGALGFVLRVDGGGFRTTSPGPGSTLLVGGNSRTTSCLSASECTAAVFPSDVALPSSLNVQMQNPDGSFSNILPLVIAAPNLTDDIIALSGAAPNAIGKDIVVVDPTTSGVSQPGDDVDLDIAALGNFSVSSNTCTLGGNPIVLVRPASGATTFDMCAFAQSGLDTSMAYTVTGNGDVAVIAKQPAGLGIIHLTLQVQSNAQSGARTLFIQNLNLDKAAASGVLEVQ